MRNKTLNPNTPQLMRTLHNNNNNNPKYPNPRLHHINLKSYML